MADISLVDSHTINVHTTDEDLDFFEVPNLDLYSFMPQSMRDADVSGDLYGYCRLLSIVLTRVQSQIDLTRDFPLLQHEWFANAWCDLIGFPELREIFVWDDLRRILPHFLRLIKLKGQRFPIVFLVEKLFDDIDPFSYSVPSSVNASSGTFVVDVYIPPDYSTSKIKGVSPSIYLASKVSSLNRLLYRFVPVYLDPSVRVNFFPFLETFDTDAVDDSVLSLAIALGETYTLSTSDSDLHFFLKQTYVEPVDFSRVDSDLPALNNHVLNSDWINNSRDPNSGWLNISDDALTITSS